MMALLNPGFVLAVLALLYISTFVLFAVLRVVTGISIQRIGYLSLRRISYKFKEGIKIDIHSLGLQFHRPTLTQPTWLTLRVSGLCVTVEPAKLKTAGDDKVNTAASASPSRPVTPEPTTTTSTEADGNLLTPPALEISTPLIVEPDRSDLWVKLTRIKEKIKRLHREVEWLKLIDVHAMETTCRFPGLAEMQIGSFGMLVDTRRRTVNRGRLFRHKKEPSGFEKAAEWIMTINNVLFCLDGKEPVEVLDLATLNIHGLLIPDLDGLRDASVSLKLGRVHIPYDDFDTCSKLLQQRRGLSKSKKAVKTPKLQRGMSFDGLIEEMHKPLTHEDRLVQTLSDSKDFISSILRGIQEIQLGISFLAVSKQICSTQITGSPLYLNAALNEFGVDLHRLDPRTPAHRMYFPREDIAHQALLAAISISISVDDGQGSPNRLIYVPMATTTIKTTLPSKTVSATDDIDASTRNSNILFANLVVTSPSIDLDPKYLPIVLIPFNKAKSPSPRMSHHHGNLISRLLPKANVKFSIHEPVLRIVLPLYSTLTKDPDDYEMLIASISSISLDLESSHSAGGVLHYSLASNLRVSSWQFYYQTAMGERYNLLMAETLELKMQMSASPEVYVILTGGLRTVSVHMVKKEVTLGIGQIMEQLKRRSIKEKKKLSPLRKPSMLRNLPAWLLEFRFEGTDMSIEVAGIDEDVAKCTRGVALQLASWNAEYKSQKEDMVQKRSSRRRTISRSIASDDARFVRLSPPSPARKPMSDQTDGRRLAVHVRNLEGFVIENLDVWEPENFVSLPRFEVALSTSNDGQGPIFHVNSYMRSLFINYSLYRFYAMGIAATVLTKAFNISPSEVSSGASPPLSPISPIAQHIRDSSAHLELTTLDVKASLIQIKAVMPSDPPVMLQIYGLEAGRHRWSAPFFKSKLLRLYAEAPKVRRVWARVISVKNLRVDLRQNRKKKGKIITEENSIDMTTDFIRIGVPHQLIVYHMIDNFVDTGKATVQLLHRFKTGSNEYIAEKGPKGPKIIPRVSVRTKTLAFEIEDSPFEWKLACIYRTGLIEQKQRLAREEAFNLKAKRIEELESYQGSSRWRTQSSRPSRSRNSSGAFVRSKSSDTRPRSPGPRHSREQSMRYDASGRCGFTSSARISIDEAKYKLQVHNAQSWKRRIDAVLRSQGTSANDVRNLFWDADEYPDDEDSSEIILALPRRPGLMTTLISDVHLVLDKPSFPIQEYPQFLHRMGKGMPLDMKYDLLVPVSIQLDMGEARITLRDYPLPFIHVPGMRPGQNSRIPAWSLKTDFVIAEEYRNYESTRHVQIDVIPPDASGQREPTAGFAIDVCRTVSPVKTYSDMAIDINTSLPTIISWGTSYQPVIQDMMMCIENFSKPQVDASDRVGFWDKIRLSFHSRILVSFKGDGDVHLRMKGSRDPYEITGYGSGFIMCWRNDVKWAIHATDDPRKFMQVSSGECVLAIPDYSQAARQAMEQKRRDSESLNSGSSTNSSSLRNALKFSKVVMKLSGNVEWTAGLVFERNTDEGKRSYDFKNHYEVVLRNPEYAKPASDGKEYDAFRGFRSDHIHLSLSVVAPVDRDWSINNQEPSASYNTVHLTPKLLTHFFAWFSTFSGPMALPVRQGSLWGEVENSSKKFGRHLGTIKYSLLLSPVFLAHIYKHKDAEDYAEQNFAATGLKFRIDSFMMDLHQRREEFTRVVKDIGRINTSAMRINQAQLDLMSADIRAVSATISGTSVEEIKHASDESLASFQESGTANIDLSHFTIPDKDFSWIDMDDFVETDWILPDEANPETQILPLAFAPRFTYFRQTDHEEDISGDTSRSSAFGNEPTHFCIMSEENDPRRVQLDIIKERLDGLEEQVIKHKRALGEQELRVLKEDTNDTSAKERYELLLSQEKFLQRRKTFLQSGMYNLQQQLHSGSIRTPSLIHSQEGPYALDNDNDSDTLDSTPFSDFISDFNNRFIVHNAQLKWNNSLRNIIMRYGHQISQRRGYTYYMSRRAVKFILDIIEEQAKAKETEKEVTPEPPMQRPKTAKSTKSSASTSSQSVEKLPESPLQDAIQQIIEDGRRFVESHVEDAKASEKNSYAVGGKEKISPEYALQNSYHVRLIAPQIQFQSEKNPKSVLLITAEGMQLKVVGVMDKDRMEDDVSGLVQRRYTMHMDGAQFFVSSKDKIIKHLSLYSGNRYGNPSNSAWPPWVALEVMYDFELTPFGFDRVIQKTSASLRYDKFNTLRLKANDEVTNGDSGFGLEEGDGKDENDMDRIWLDFPKIRAVCDSSQYYAIYIVVVDLLMYIEPLEKVRNERLEKIMLASDFSDLRGTPEMVVSLQERIHQLEEIKTHFQINEKYLDRQGWQDRLAIEHDLASCEDELFFMMKAIVTSQRKTEDRPTEQTTGLLKWNLSASELVWHLMRDENEPLVEFQLRDASYERTDNSDGSNDNLATIKQLRGLNLLPYTLYPDMLGPYFDQTQNPEEFQDITMFRMQWCMLEAIAGIPVLDDFEVTLFPLKIRLDHDTGRKLFEYIFPGIGGNSFENGSSSPFLLSQNQDGDGDGDGDASDMDESQRDSIDASQTSEDSRSPNSRPHTRTGSFDLRSKSATLIPSGDGSRSVTSPKPKSHYFTLFTREKSSPTTSTLSQTIKKQSEDSLSTNRRSRTSSTSIPTVSSATSKRFPLVHSSSKDTDKQSDDLTQMMSRASSYMILAHAKVSSVVLCLSYKGKGERNIEDVHDFVFRLPPLEYSNKTWSNLDLALRLKKDIIKALISHTGAIIGNKFSKHKPSKARVNYIREMVNSSQLLPNAENSSVSVMGEASSMFGVPLSPKSYASSFQSRPKTSYSQMDSWPSTQSQTPLDNSIETRSVAPSTRTAPIGRRRGSGSTLAVPSLPFSGRSVVEGLKSRHRALSTTSTDDAEEKKKSMLFFSKKMLS